MSATLSIIAWPAVTKKASAFARLFNACWDGIARYFVSRAAIASLRELDDRALRDIGLARSQIEAAVHGFITAPDRSEDVMAAASAELCTAIGPRADGCRRASTVEAGTWS
jgi:uncharacterized protein YjiS (DUF1127 family)